MRNIQNLLNQVGIINKKNTEILEATGGRFNMFRLCGVNHYENTHSAILAELLNPKGTHGLKSKLLELFVNEIEGFENFNSEEAKVYTEYSIPNGRIDIFIEDDNKNAIIIENKVYAEDQQKQLKRYENYAKENKFTSYKILYLNLWGSEASEQSGEGVDYQSISYKENIINWLENCVFASARYPMVRETLAQYINHLKQLTNQDMDTNNKKEVTELLISNIENLKVAKNIYDNYEAMFDELVKKYFNPKMEAFAKEKGLNFTYNKCSETYIRFWLEDEKWKCQIEFTYETRYGGYYGIKSKGSQNNLSEELRKKIYENINNGAGIKGKQSPWWAFWTNTKTLTLDDWGKFINGDESLIEDYKKKIEELLKAMEGIEF